MNAEPPVARLQMEDQPRRPGYRRRSAAREKAKAELSNVPPSESRSLTTTPFLPSVLHSMIITYLNIAEILEIFGETEKLSIRRTVLR